MAADASMDSHVTDIQQGSAIQDDTDNQEADDLLASEDLENQSNDNDNDNGEDSSPKDNRTTGTGGTNEEDATVRTTPPSTGQHLDEAPRPRATNPNLKPLPNPCRWI